MTKTITFNCLFDTRGKSVKLHFTEISTLVLIPYAHNSEDVSSGLSSGSVSHFLRFGLFCGDVTVATLTNKCCST